MRAAWLLLFAPVLAAQVPYERIVNADREPGSWLTYSRNYLGQRFSPLNQITPANVAQLKVKWAYQFDVPRERSLAHRGRRRDVRHRAESRGGAGFAHRARTVALARPIPADYQNIGFGRVNRGPAILDDQLFVATLDCYLVALDIKSGQAALGDASGRLQARLQHDAGAAGVSAAKLLVGDQRRRGGHSRFRGCLRCQDR